MNMKLYREMLIGELDDLLSRFDGIIARGGTWPDYLGGRVFGLKMAFELTDGNWEDRRFDRLKFSK